MQALGWSLSCSKRSLSMWTMLGLHPAWGWLPPEQASQGKAARWSFTFLLSNFRYSIPSLCILTEQLHTTPPFPGNWTCSERAYDSGLFRKIRYAKIFFFPKKTIRDICHILKFFSLRLRMEVLLGKKCQRNYLSLSTSNLGLFCFYLLSRC